MPKPSSLIRRLHREHRARQERLARLARPDPGIQMHNGRPIALDITPVRKKYTLLPDTNGPVYGRFQRRWDFDPDRAFGIDQILRVVCRYFRITRAELLSERKTAPIVYHRQVAMYLARELTSLSLPQIGRRLGNRDHTTIMHGARKIEKLVATRPEIASEINKIKTLLGFV